MTERKGLVELLRSHPALLVEDAAPCPDQYGAEAGQRHFGERQKQLHKAGLTWGEQVLKYPAPERRPAGNPGPWRKLERRFRPGQPNLACSGAFRASNAPEPALSFSILAPYIEGAGSPAMEINCRRNKPFGPGGSPRRLPPSPLPSGGFRRGRNRIDEGVKGELFPGIVPPLSGYAIVANDNYAPVAQAA